MKSALLTCQANQPTKRTEENVPDQRRGMQRGQVTVTDVNLIL